MNFLKKIKFGSLSSNITANLIQTVFSIIFSFFLFRYVIISLGAASFGIWSVVLATVSTSRLFELGISAAVVRYVALDKTNKNKESASETIQSATIGLFIFLSILIPLLFFPLNYLFPIIFDGLALEDAQTLLPYALFSLFVNVIASVFQAGFEGYQRMELRAFLIISGQLVMLLMAIYFIPLNGLIGMAYAQVIQALYLALFGWILLRRVIKNLPFFPNKFSLNKIKQMLPYGINVQAASLFMLFFDPLTKALMTKFAGPAAAGYFEIANQVASKVRAVIITTNQAVVPKVTEIIEKNKTSLQFFYNNNIKLIFFITIPTYVLLELWSPQIISILSGSYNLSIHYIYHFTLFAWFFNLFAGPAYFSNLGSGRVTPNTISHFTMGIINLTLGIFLGLNFNLKGVTWAYSVSLIFGSIYLIINYNTFNKTKLSSGLLFNNKIFIISNLCILFYSFYINGNLSEGLYLNDLTYRVQVIFSLFIIIITYLYSKSFIKNLIINE